MLMLVLFCFLPLSAGALAFSVPPCSVLRNLPAWMSCVRCRVYSLIGEVKTGTCSCLVCLVMLWLCVGRLLILKISGLRNVGPDYRRRRRCWSSSFVAIRMLRFISALYALSDIPPASPSPVNTSGSWRYTYFYLCVLVRFWRRQVKRCLIYD